MIPPRRQRRNGMDLLSTLMIYLGICEEIHNNIRWTPRIRGAIANPKRVFGMEIVVVVALMMVCRMYARDIHVRPFKSQPPNYIC